MKRVVYDTNVLLDVLLRREPHFATSASALDAVEAGAVKGYVSGHAVATIAYFLQRDFGRARSRALIADLLSRLEVAPVTDAGVRRALGSGIDDIEDAICHAAAEDAGAAMIVTRNVRDFRRGSIPAIDPAIFVSDAGAD